MSSVFCIFGISTRQKLKMKKPGKSFFLIQIQTIPTDNHANLNMKIQVLELVGSLILYKDRVVQLVSYSLASSHFAEVI